jgi:hypothetical protein
VQKKARLDAPSTSTAQDKFGGGKAHGNLLEIDPSLWRAYTANLEPKPDFDMFNGAIFDARRTEDYCRMAKIICHIVHSTEDSQKRCTIAEVVTSTVMYNDDLQKVKN